MEGGKQGGTDQNRPVRVLFRMEIAQDDATEQHFLVKADEQGCHEDEGDKLNRCGRQIVIVSNQRIDDKDDLIQDNQQNR